ncbi:hypothetical protein H0H92_007183 [Tricholoma furcatifolium]|nr:hypothetical protein H0H92_007183 [Tricholoma furcatifolium]
MTISQPAERRAETQPAHPSSQLSSSSNAGSPRALRAVLKRSRENNENVPSTTPAKLIQTGALPIINNAAPPRIVPEFLDSIQAITEQLEHLKGFQRNIQRKIREGAAAHESEIESMKKQLEETKQDNVRLRELVTSTANKLMVEGYRGVEDSKDFKQEAPAAVAEPKLEG